MEAVGAHYAALFGNDPAMDKLRDAYAIPANTIKTPERQQAMNAFFFWTAWACATQRARQTDHLHQQLARRSADRQPPHRQRSILWSVISFVILLAGVGALVWYFAAEHRKRAEEPMDVPLTRSRCWR